MKETHFSIHNDPNGHELWRSISGNFQRFPEIINEFVDDALSNFRATKPDQRRVEIRLRQWEEFVDVSVVDTGTGIRDIHAALTLGNRSGGETDLNEHGMGLKHALASACEDGSWSIQSRTPEDNTQDRHLVVRGPYRLGDDPMTGYYLPGRGILMGPTGTAVSFTCTRDFFATLRPAGDRTDKPFEVLVDILLEELGYTYAPILENKEMEMAVVVGDHVYPVEPVFPTWDPNCFKETPPTVLDLGGGPVTVNCCWGLIRADKDMVGHIMEVTLYEKTLEGKGLVDYSAFKYAGRQVAKGILDKAFPTKSNDAYMGMKSVMLQETYEYGGSQYPSVLRRYDGRSYLCTTAGASHSMSIIIGELNDADIYNTYKSVIRSNSPLYYSSYAGGRDNDVEAFELDKW